MRDQVDAFELLSNGWETLDGERTLVRMVRFQVADSAPLVQLQAFFVRDGLGYAHLRHGHRAGVSRRPSRAFREALDGLRFAAPAETAPGALQVLRG